MQPLVAYALAHLALGRPGHALLAVVVCSSLPTAQNIFVHATRYDRSPTLARDTILVTTVGAVPLITLAVWVLGEPSTRHQSSPVGLLGVRSPGRPGWLGQNGGVITVGFAPALLRESGVLLGARGGRPLRHRRRAAQR